MRETWKLIQIGAFSAASLFLTALAVALVVLAVEVSSPSEFWGPYGAFRAGLYATLLIGAVPAILMGTPAYWLLRRTGRAQWLTVIPLGAGLGSLVAVLEPAFLGWGAGCGMIVAGLTHMAAQRWLGPNNSFKPTPLRGAA